MSDTWLYEQFIPAYNMSNIDNIAMFLIILKKNEKNVGHTTNDLCNANTMFNYRWKYMYYWYIIVYNITKYH